jgi:hypothetical protein
MTTHDDTLHPRDTSTGEFTTKGQSAPETSIPGLTPAGFAMASLEREYAANAEERNALDRKEFALARKILAAKIEANGIEGAHTLTLVDGNNEGSGAPYWEAGQILDSEGNVLWDQDNDLLFSDELTEYTAALDRLGDDAISLGKGEHGIVLATPTD